MSCSRAAELSILRWLGVDRLWSLCSLSWLWATWIYLVVRDLSDTVVDKPKTPVVTYKLLQVPVFKTQTFQTHNGQTVAKWGLSCVLQSYCRVPCHVPPSRSASFVSKPKTRKYAARVASSSISLPLTQKSCTIQARRWVPRKMLRKSATRKQAIVFDNLPALSRNGLLRPIHHHQWSSNKVKAMLDNATASDKLQVYTSSSYTPLQASNKKCCDWS